MPIRIDRSVEHWAKVCPDCGGPLQQCRRTRTRITEDIPETIQPVVTQHTIHRDFCPRCNKDVEPRVLDALPNATLGHRGSAATLVRRDIAFAMPRNRSNWCTIHHPIK
ncbi:MAG: IS66 family transposase zinc-finger binding domain-containing protein [Phycisphaerales bacterium]|nr:IS66 family transposase zinc-finger binding domain-containing protein [Phycisphaerales bacterium]